MPQTDTASITGQALEILCCQVPVDPWFAELKVFVGKLASGELIAR